MPILDMTPLSSAWKTSHRLQAHQPKNNFVTFVAMHNAWSTVLTIGKYRWVTGSVETYLRHDPHLQTLCQQMVFWQDM